MKRQLVTALLCLMIPVSYPSIKAEASVAGSLQQSAGITAVLQNVPDEAIPSIYNIGLSADLQVYTYTMCRKYDIVDYYPTFLAQMWHESRFDADVISKTNDYGLMQINKINHENLREVLGITDFLDAKQNIEAGAYTMSNLLHKYGDVNTALLCYNRGERGAKLLIERNKNIYTTNYYIISISQYLNISISQ